jgi:hypothetical protein
MKHGWNARDGDRSLWGEISRILLFTQTVLLIPKVNVQYTPTHVNSRKCKRKRELTHAT